MHRGQRFLQFLLSSSLLALLAACGGGDGGGGSAAGGGSGGGTDVAAEQPTSAHMAAFATDYAAGLAALNTYGGLTNTAFLDNFDSAFLDSGYSKPQVREALAQEAAALLLFSTDLSSFPGVKLSNVSVTNCAASVCTLTATLTNTDADTTSVSFTTSLSFSGGKLRLLGDQKQA